MNAEIKKLLDYQTLDSKLNSIEHEMISHPNRAKAQKMLTSFKNEQQMAENLEKEASKAVEEFNKVKSLYEANAKLAGKLSGIDVDKLSDEKIAKLNSDLENVLNNLGAIEKKLVALNKNVETILAGFENAKKQATIARNSYLESKNAYDEFVKSKADEIAKLKSGLIAVAKTLNQDLYKKYQSIRGDKIFPVLVPLNSGLCGYCQMNINANDANRLKENGYIICENCHRIIYI